MGVMTVFLNACSGICRSRGAATGGAWHLQTPGRAVWFEIARAGLVHARSLRAGRLNFPVCVAWLLRSVLVLQSREQAVNPWSTAKFMMARPFPIRYKMLTGRARSTRAGSPAASSLAW